MPFFTSSSSCSMEKLLRRFLELRNRSEMQTVWPSTTGTRLVCAEIFSGQLKSVVK